MHKWGYQDETKRLRLVVYLMLSGSSHPYPWLILEENGRQNDDDDVIRWPISTIGDRCSKSNWSRHSITYEDLEYGEGWLYCDIN